MHSNVVFAILISSGTKLSLYSLDMACKSGCFLYLFPNTVNASSYNSPESFTPIKIPLA